MIRRWQDERGSAMLLVLMAIVIIPILFGGLYLTLQHSNKLTAEHEAQVQAEYEAQKMMEVALYFYYKEPDKFTEKLDPCYENAAGTAKVCLAEETSGKRTLTATAEQGNRSVAQELVVRATSKIEHVLSASAAGDVGDGDSDSDRTTPPSMTPPADDTTGPVSPGQVCPPPSAGKFPLKALVLGQMLDLDKAKRDNKELTVHIEGGVYVGERKTMHLPREANHKSIRINGWIYAEDGFEYNKGTGNDKNRPDPDDFGPAAQLDNCTPMSDFHTALNQHGAYYLDKLHPINVYHFQGANLNLNSVGCKKSHNTSNCHANSETLKQVLAKTEPKVVLVEGNLTLTSPLKSSGYLIVYNPSGTSTIRLPDNFEWTHQGAVATERIYDLNISDWPTDYQLFITLTQMQEKLYQRN